MSKLELILTAITAILTGGNFLQFISIRQIREKMNGENKKQHIENRKESDEVLYKRIHFLEERITRLEKLACFDSDCLIRK